MSEHILASSPIKSSHFETALLFCSGTLRYLYDDCLRQNKVPHPEFAMASALTIIGTLTQRSYELQEDVSTSIYSLLVGEAGSGKNGYLKYVRKHCTALDEKLLLDEVRSSQGLKREIVQFPSKVAVFDEVGDEWMRGFGQRPDQSVAQFLKEILELYNVMDESLGSSRSSEKDSVKRVKRPRLSVMGLSTRLDAIQLLKCKQFVKKGFLSRFCFWFGETQDVAIPYSKEVRKMVVEEETLRKLMTIYHQGRPPAVDTEQNGNTNAPDGRLEMTYSEEAHTTFMLFNQKLDEIKADLKMLNNGDDLENGEPSIINRMRNRIERFACAQAAGRSSLVVEAYDAMFAEHMCRHLLDRTLIELEQTAKTEDQEAEERILRYLDSRGSCVPSEITNDDRFMRGLGLDRVNSIFKALIESGAVEDVSDEHKRGRKALRIAANRQSVNLHVIR